MFKQILFSTLIYFGVLEPVIHASDERFAFLLIIPPATIVWILASNFYQNYQREKDPMTYMAYIGELKEKYPEAYEGVTYSKEPRVQ
jgi:hypothetical protein